MSEFKQLVLRACSASTILTCLLYLADGILAKLNRVTINEAEHLSGVNIDDDYQYAADIAAQYLSAGAILGKVAEVGPGGNAAVALHLLANGANCVDLIDKFAFTHNEQNLDNIYRKFDNYQDLAKITYYVGENASAERFFRSRRGYDAILSCAVLEHLLDPLAALASMTSALAPGGRTIYQVDLRDHGMFSSSGKTNLHFLPSLICSTDR